MTHAPRPADADIDTLVLLAEQRLIDREQRVRQSVRRFSRQLHDATRPERLAKPALIAGGVALWLMLRRRHPRAAAAAPAGHPAVPAAARPALFVLLAGIPWTRLLSHAWPLMPGRWRERLNPATAASLLTLGLPVLEGLLTRRRRDDAERPR